LARTKTSTTKLVGQLPSVSVESILAGGNRKGKRSRPTDGDAFTGLTKAQYFTFDDADSTHRLWQPQGLTCASDAGSDLNAFLVSWYLKTSETNDASQAVRVSFLQPTAKNACRYRHVLLVVPTGDGDYDPLKIHAGGIAWYGDFLYVADTTRGFRVFDLTKILDVPNIAGDEKVGKIDGTFHARGYSHVIPQVESWKLTTAGAAKFSFVAVDRSRTPHLLVSGEYDKTGKANVTRWQLNEDGTLLTVNDRAVAVDHFELPVTKVQGAVSFDGRWYLSQSRGSTAKGSLLAGPAKDLAIRPYPVGPEDLTVHRAAKTIWTVTEFHGHGRALFGVPLT
jgi:hypothetical protein